MGTAGEGGVARVGICSPLDQRIEEADLDRASGLGLHFKSSLEAMVHYTRSLESFTVQLPNKGM